MQRKRFAGMLIAGLLLVVVLTGGLLAQRVLNPTYEYYGEILNATEFMDLFNQGVPLQCVQKMDSSFILRGLFTVEVVCFHTTEEVDAYIDAMMSRTE